MVIVKAIEMEMEMLGENRMGMGIRGSDSGGDGDGPAIFVVLSRRGQLLLKLISSVATNNLSEL